VKAERLETEFAGFAGGASGFGDPDFVEVLRSESVVPGTGLSVDALQSIARRQLIGSVVAAALVVAIAALTAMQPMRGETAGAPSHNFAVVQQPTFTSQHFAASKHREVELP
jgi:hypothetical protein